MKQYPTSQQWNRHRNRQFFLLFSTMLLTLLMLSQCTSGNNPSETGSETDGRNYTVITPNDTINHTEDEEAAGLQLVLSDGVEQPSDVEENPAAETIALTAEEAQLVFDRLPALEVEAEDAQAFKLPETVLPPPLTGETVDETFPPQAIADSIEPIEEGPLQLLRFSPEGEIPLAPFLNVTFNQPMVPLTTLEELSAADVPVKLTPELPGLWRWLGTKTLSFDYQSDEIDRFPMATEYTVEIPAGTESATGGVLEKSVSWTFRTPPPQIELFLPNNSPQPLNPLFFVQFDQRVNPEDVLETVQVTAGRQEYPVRLATEEEIEAEAEIKRLVERAGEARWLAFRAEEEFPQNQTVNISIGPETPSAEGPLVTESVQSFSFQTYDALRIERKRCGWSDRECPPFSPFFIEFNNPIDLDAFDESMLSIVPDIPGAVVEIFGRTLSIRGATQGRTAYTVVVDETIQDTFGQTLGTEAELTFRTTEAPQVLTGPRESFITLDPSSSSPLFTVYSINYSRIRVKAYQVEPQDWPDYASYLEDYWRTDDPPTPPGKLAWEETIQVDGANDELTETNIDLSSALDGQFGHLIVVVDIPRSLLSLSRDLTTVQSWVQVTQIGVDAFTDHSQMMVWADALQDGTPLSGVDVELYPSHVKGTTDTDGTTTLELSDQGALFLLASQEHEGETDTAMLLPTRYYWDENSWSRQAPEDHLRWYVFDDRAMYRPGEEVSVKGWIRRIGAGQTGDVEKLGGSANSINYRVIGPQGNDITDGTAEVNTLGGFDLNFTLPEQVNLGYASVEFDVTGDFAYANSTDYWHSFQVQEFRRPEFEVSAGNETVGPYFVGDDATAFVSASYFAGGPLPNADTYWNVSASPSSYTPPNWPDFTFGTWVPWWRSYYDEPMGESSFYNFESKTDAAGRHYLDINIESLDDPQPYSILAEATIFDLNRQAWASSTTLLVHPADLYVGLYSERTFVQKGEPLEIEAIVTDLEGNAFADQAIEMSAARLEWKYGRGMWHEEEVDAQLCNVTSEDAPITCSFETELGGRYRITAIVEDAQGRQNRSEFIRWVSGGKQPAARTVEQEEVTLVPDKESYQPGDVAEILVQAPFAPAEGLLTVSRSGILYTERFAVTDGSYTLQIPIEEGHTPNLHVQVDLNGSAPRADAQGELIEGIPPRPAYAIGQLDLSIPPLNRTLALEVTPLESKLEPGGSTTLDVTLHDANGDPVADAELAVVVVDEAILALTNYQLADPVAAFYGSRGSDVSSYYGRETLLLVDSTILNDNLQEKTVENEVARGVMQAESTVAAASITSAPMAEEESMEEAAMGGEMDLAFAADEAGSDSVRSNENTAIQVRSNFNPLATFAPEVRTDENGKAEIQIELPDNLTRYRVMVVAVAGETEFGSGESNLTARLPLMVRPSAPRFLNFGDRFELPIVIQNQTDEPLETDVVIEAGNIELTEGIGQRVTIPANDRVEVRFPATTLSAGTARFQIAATSGTYADAATVDLPVYTPATTEAFATYGVVDEGAVVQPIGAPEDVFPQFGGLEINTSSTALQALTDAVLYLTRYPYECSEQMASRVLAIAALKDVLTAFEAEGLPTPEEMEASVQRDIEQLQRLQNWDGGYPVWSRGRDSIPYYSIFVAQSLHLAQEKGFAVPQEMQMRSLDYLREVESHYPYWYSTGTRQTLSAYALYVRDLMGDTDTAKTRSLYQEKKLDNWSLEALAWMLQVFSGDASSTAEIDAILRHFNNRAVETAGAANFTTDYGDDAYLMLHSNRRTDGIILDALIDAQPESDLIPKVVNGLMAHRKKGRWNNTQENAFILVALDRYFNTFESQTPDFVAQIWLGDTYVGGHEFAGRTTERHESNIPMAYLVNPELGGGDSQDLVLNKEGDGRLYYRLGLSYAPTDLELEPLDMGFVVQRSYEAVDDPGDVSRDEDGTWRIEAGARVRVRLNMVATNRRYHVALVDPLPAGLEIVNPALAVSGSIPNDPSDSSGRTGWWWGTWYEHQNMRDERAEAFTTLLWDGVYDYTYIARATTPGEFVVPPAKAEEMYSPEVFGRSGSDRVVVE